MAGPPKPKTPIGKLRDSLDEMSSMVSSAHGFDGKPALDRVKAPSEINVAARKVKAHIDQSITGARNALTASVERKSPKSKKPKKR